MFPRRAAVIVLIAMALLLAAAGGILWYLDQPHCPFTREPAVVSGGSLEPLVKDGAQLTLLQGYYACREVRRGDLVAFRYGGSTDPLVKIAKGIPGDIFALDPQPRATWHIMINGAVVKNSTGVPYQVIAPEKALLELYIGDYRGVIPRDTYLFLGDSAEESKDSRRFGLVAKSDVIGKVR